MPDRISAIEAMLEARPDDVFLRYSLGIELLSAGRADEAAAAFRECIRINKQYLPAYVEAGKALRAAGRADEARALFREGLALAGQIGETHTADAIRIHLESLDASG